VSLDLKAIAEKWKQSARGGLRTEECIDGCAVDAAVAILNYLVAYPSFHRRVWRHGGFHAELTVHAWSPVDLRKIREHLKAQP
jgi:hypothetical protein